MPRWGREAQTAEGFLESVAPFVKESYRRDAGMTGRGEETSAAKKQPESKTAGSVLLAEAPTLRLVCSMALALCLLVAGNMLVTCASFLFLRQGPR